MPRKGKGQKVQTATGQQYGQAKAQEEAQEVVPLAQMPAPPRVRPAENGPLRRPSERPQESIGAMPVAAAPAPASVQGVNTEELKAQLPVLEAIASQPGASSQTKAFVRQLRMVAMRNGVT
jgi:hypothetical protein|tara:strand:- start:723 stop:1085 length:363 start_codon:yes stop_codon:yes gene_type:complete